jgi:RNA polymerase sigma-70 factor (ECF subfamily)
MNGEPFGGAPRGSSEEVVSHAVPALPSRPSLRGLSVPCEESEARARAFRALYESHLDFVWRNLRRLGVEQADVEDRAQEVFVVAHRRFDEFEDRGRGPRAWLFQIVLRVASDARRHRRRHPEYPDGGDACDRISVEPPQAQAMARRDILAKLDAALSVLDLDRRAVLVLHEIEEMTAPEIAQVLSIPLNTVYSRLRVAREKLEMALHSAPAFSTRRAGGPDGRGDGP